jgi:hypothetical protein
VFQLSLGVPQIASIGLGALLISVISYRVLLAAVAAVAIVAAGYLLSAPSSSRIAATMLSREPGRDGRVRSL